MKVVIFNVKFSENLGDGLLATCLEDQIRSYMPAVRVKTLDLAGRVNYGGTSSHRHLLLKVLASLPAALKQLVVRNLVSRKVAKLKTGWDDEIAAADAVIIGGGNLFQDDDLNFPVKIAAVLETVHRNKKPLAIYAVGVTADWSSQAQALFGAVKTVNIVHCSVRDKMAQQAWIAHFPDFHAPLISPDPALCASRPLPGEKNRNRTQSAFRPLVGLCVTDPTILERHSSSPGSSITFRSADNYLSLITSLAGYGYEVLLFCNGAREDYQLLEKIGDTVVVGNLIDRAIVHLAPRPVNPADLLGIIAKSDAIIAHRLHACIAAYALDIPPIGLGWDSKVEAFFDLSGRRNYFVEGNAPAEEIAQKVNLLFEKSFDLGSNAHLKNESIEGIKRLVDDLLSAQQTLAE